MAEVKTHEQLSDALVRAQCAQVTEKKAAWILLQEPDFVGFGVVEKERIVWPPGVEPDWSRVSDLRLFGEKGEWHLWSLWDGSWKSRLLERKMVTGGIEEFHYLWGTKRILDEKGWNRVTEERGAVLRLPVVVAEKELPLRLKLVQVVGTDPRNGLAGIVDAALVSLCNAACQEIEAPCNTN